MAAAPLARMLGRGTGAPCEIMLVESPEIGSIGRAIDIGQRLFGQPVTPLIIGTPQLKRYTVFGNHFLCAPEKFRDPRIGMSGVVMKQRQLFNVRILRESNRVRQAAVAPASSGRVSDTSPPVEIASCSPCAVAACRTPFRRTVNHRVGRFVRVPRTF